MYAVKTVNLPGAIDDVEMAVRKYSYNMSTRKSPKLESIKTPIKITVKPPLGQLQDVDTNSNSNVEYNNQNRTPKNSSIKQPQYPTLPNKPTQSQNEPTLKPNKNQALSKNEISPRNSIREPLVTNLFIKIASSLLQLCHQRTILFYVELHVTEVVLKKECSQLITCISKKMEPKRNFC